MSTRSIAISVAAVAVVVAVLAVAVSSDGGGSTALSVNGTEVSRARLNDELAAWSGSAPIARSYRDNKLELSRSDGSINTLGAAQWIAFRIRGAAVEQELERRGLDVSDNDRDTARRSLGKRFLRTLSDDTAATLVQAQAAENVLFDELGEDGAIQAIRRHLRHADVAIDPRYGVWNTRRLGVCTPVRCTLLQGAVPSGSTG
jgi:hypothetical protein